ncbi:hypothetical protein T4B_7149 [Trichinella pseudospiralis]|uniref:Uncharacterized protein n=1 Tax=Trichinella pseudospiralis TaxID=6337 RepID=A0A0V1J7V3_TRIPS|nr:hypothetical protein T4A_13362 [Trichinella pseudospiralis]KRZ24530.1 hypothetical protein T4B_7149 [Trichinella pseudospiralis]KRZ31066.1 hypothetical protein T4C_1877 [Trichinella pseudospiralis]
MLIEQHCPKDNQQLMEKKITVIVWMEKYQEKVKRWKKNIRKLLFASTCEDTILNVHFDKVTMKLINQNHTQKANNFVTLFTVKLLKLNEQKHNNSHNLHYQCAGAGNG